MTGLSGALDNDPPADDYVGIAPFAITYSLKITHNTYLISNNTCGSSEYRYCIEDDDFVMAVDFAANNRFGVISMSFSGSFGSSVSSALQRAYTTYDVLPMASTGNSASDGSHPAGYSYVMGVGGLDEYGVSIYRDNNEDIAAYSGGGTLAPATCSDYAPNYRCTPGGYTFRYSSSGGTSSSTANAAAIAGLVRSRNPGLTAGQVWSRLVAASSGTEHRLNALVAVRGY